MREFIIEVLTRVIVKFLTIAWFLIRPIFYLYLVWVGMNVGKIFN